MRSRADSASSSSWIPTVVLLGSLAIISIMLITDITQTGFNSGKTHIKAAGQALAVGAPVQAIDGTVVGKVSRISRDPNGHIHRIRIATAAPLGLGERTISVRDSAFTVIGNVVKMRLTLTEVNALPTVMTEDGAAASMSAF